MQREWNPTALLDVACREEFEPFFERAFVTLNPGVIYIRVWHTAAIAHLLEKMERGEIRNLLVNIPPRYMKSQMISVAYTASSASPMACRFSGGVVRSTASNQASCAICPSPTSRSS